MIITVSRRDSRRSCQVMYCRGPSALWRRAAYLHLSSSTPSFLSSSASLNFNVSASHYPVAMKTHLTAHLSTSRQVLVDVGVWICAGISPNVCICFHTVRMNHHVDWVESPSLCYKPDSARYLVMMYCMCVLSESPAWAVWAHTKRQLCRRERSITALGLFSVFPVVILSKENSTFHMSLLISKVGWEAGPLRSTRPDGQQWPHSASELSEATLALGTSSGKEQECRDVCPRLWLHMMGGRRFI